MSRRSTTSDSIRVSPVALVVAAGVLLLVALALYSWADLYATNVAWRMRAGFYVGGPLAALLLPALTTLVFAVNRQHRPAFAVGAFTVLMFGLTCWWASSVHGYQQARVYWSAAQIQPASDTGLPPLGQRAPYEVANAQVRSNLGDTTGRVVDSTRVYLADKSVYSTLVQRNGSLTGYEVVLEQTVPLTGSATGRTCTFNRDRATAKIGGGYSHSLNRQLAHRKRGVVAHADDAYGYCDGATPMVVLPTTEQSGILRVTERFAGVGLYNGTTGQLDFLTDAAAIRAIPGPTYPISLAAKQRTALKAAGSYRDWRKDRTGWESTDTGEDATPNADNATELTLPLGAGDAAKPAYVTPLTGRGSATAISAAVVVDADAATAATRGGLAPAVVYPFAHSWKSPGTIAKKISADYNDIPNWTRLRIFELAPTGTDRWVATIGNDTNVLYRVVGTGQLTEDLVPQQPGDQVTCLQRADGSTIRCGTLADTAGNGVGTEYGPGTTPSTSPGTSPAAPLPADSRLDGLSDRQLADLLTRIAAETQRRATVSN